MCILSELWDHEKKEEVQTTYQYVFNVRERLEDTCRLAHEQLSKAQERYKLNYDRQARDRVFHVGEKVLVMLPTSNNKLLLQWRGPYQVMERNGNVDYRISVNGKLKIFHANMLKKYTTRQEAAMCVEEVGAAVVEENQEDTEQSLDLPGMMCTETWKQVTLNDQLSDNQQEEVGDLLKSFEDVWTDVPGKTNWIEHKISLIEVQVVRTKPYKIPYALREGVNRDLQ